MSPFFHDANVLDQYVLAGALCGITWTYLLRFLCSSGRIFPNIGSITGYELRPILSGLRNGDGVVYFQVEIA